MTELDRQEIEALVAAHERAGLGTVPLWTRDARRIFRGLDAGHEAMQRYRNDVHFYSATNWLAEIIKGGLLDADALRECLLVAEEIVVADAYCDSRRHHGARDE